MPSADISFNQIPNSQRTPGKYFEYDTTGAVNTLPGNPQSLIVIAQRTADGSVPADVPTQIFSDADAATFFGEGSMAHMMVVAALKTNPYVNLSVVALDDDPAGVAATGSLVIAGPATANGAISFAIANQPVNIAVNSGDTAGAIAAALVAQIANQPALPVTAAVDAQNPATINITAKNKGLAANSISLVFTSQTASVTGAVTSMTGGLNDPDISGALATVFGASYTMYVSGYATQMALHELDEQLQTISGPLEERRATGYGGWTGTYAQGTTLAAAVNSGRISIAWHSGSMKTPWEVAAAYAAEIAAEEDPSMPLNTLPLAALDATPPSAWPSKTEIELALWNGLSPLKVGPGGTVQIVRAISTYLVNAAGAPDPSLLDITTIRTLDYMANAWQQRIELRFPRAKNTARTAAAVRSELLDVAYQAQDAEIIQNVDQYKANFLVEQDLDDSTRLDVSIPCNVVSGLYVFAAKINLIL
jgi:phage tail sheath gpL-like